MIGWCWCFELVIRRHILVGMCVDAKSCSFLCIEICISKLTYICNFDSASSCFALALPKRWCYIDRH